LERRGSEDIERRREIGSSETWSGRVGIGIMRIIIIIIIGISDNKWD
jgi:hypothetical protein